MLASLALFALGSAACAAAPSPGAFIAGRAVLGVAGAGVIVMALSGLTVMFPEEERPRAVGVWSAANFLGLPIGPILGGWLLTHAWWGWVFLLNVPIAAVGFVATLVLVPESRASRRPGLDPIGVVASAAGLVGLTYGLIEVGQNGWGDTGAWLPMCAGAVLIAGFLAWERRLARRPGGRPLLDPGLFRSAAYRWGVILAAVAVLGMVGILFTLPQYFEGVAGADAMGSGVRLLPLIGGLLVGAMPASLVARALGARVAATLGFAVLSAGMALGAWTGAGSGDAFVAAWMAIAGVGMGVALATVASTALSELPAEHAGVGSAALQALNKLGGPVGTAVLGSVLSGVYLGRLHLAGLPAPAVAAVRRSVFGGVSVAHRLGSATLLHDVRAAFVQGMDVALVVSAGVALAGGVLALVFLPRTAATGAAEEVRVAV